MIDQDVTTDRGSGSIDLDAGWMLDERVQIRPERFGGLLYHFGTRQLSFVKAPDLLQVLRLLADSETAAQAMDSAGIEPARRPAIEQALGSLAASAMICRRSGKVAA